MYQGRVWPEYERAAALLAAIANTVPQDPKHPRKPAHPHDFFKRPGEKRQANINRLTPQAFRSLKPAFTKKRT